MARKSKLEELDEEMIPSKISLEPERAHIIRNNGDGDFQRFFTCDIPDFFPYTLDFKQLELKESFSRLSREYPEVIYLGTGKLKLCVEYFELNKHVEYELSNKHRIYLPRRTLTKIEAIEPSALIILAGGINRKENGNGNH